MATSDAIRYLGDTLVSILQAGLKGTVPAANISLSTPDAVKQAQPSPPAVTIFLYQVGICGELRNTRHRALGSGEIRRPPLPLDLRFLITPWSKAPEGAYQIIGAVAQIFYDHAILGFSELLGEGVWSADDTVEILMESLPVEEHYDIWDPTDLPYRLSLAYLARVIGIDSLIRSPSAPVVGLNVAQGGP